MYDGLEEVTRLFDGKTVFIQSCSNKKWVTTREDMELHPVFCTADEPLKWEEFTIGVLKDGWCFLRAFTGEYLSVRKDCHSKFYKTPKVDPRDNPYYGSEELAAFGLWFYDSNCFFDIFEEDKIV